MKFLLIIMSISLLASCGPKEIGYSYADNPANGANAGSTAEVMRYPVAGSSNTQKMLYHANLPSVMEQTQRWHTSQFRRQLGLDASPEDEEYRAIPKQQSPFRQ